MGSERSSLGNGDWKFEGLKDGDGSVWIGEMINAYPHVVQCMK